MKTFLIVLGSASLIYGGYLALQKSKKGATRHPCSRRHDRRVGSAGIVTGPSMVSTADAGVNSNIGTQVAQFGSIFDKFAPISYIGVPVDGPLPNPNQQVYQPMKF